jgi:hypothetical protein
LPYVIAWEYKPPGLFALCAAGLLVFGNADLASSMLATIAVIVTAFAVSAILNAAGGPQARSAATLSALGVVLLSTENAGTKGDAELFINAFIGLAFASALVKPAWRAMLLSSIAAAAALQMKLTALPLVAAVAVMPALAIGRSAAPYCIAFAAIVLVPFALEAALYARAGALPAFLDANVFATVRRASAGVAPSSARAVQWMEELRILAPAIEFAPVAFFRLSRGGVVAALWLAGAVAAIVGAHEYYARHLELLVPPVAMLGSLGALRCADAFRGRARTAFLAATVIATFFLHDYFEVTQGARALVYRYVLRAPDWGIGDYTLVRSAIENAMHGDRSLYAMQVSPEIYADLDAPPPTRYIFSANLLEKPMWPMLGFSGRSELARILATKPHVIAVGPPGDGVDAGGIELLESTLAHDYRLVATVRGVLIYTLRGLA